MLKYHALKCLVYYVIKEIWANCSQKTKATFFISVLDPHFLIRLMQVGKRKKQFPTILSTTIFHRHYMKIQTSIASVLYTDFR